MLEEPGWKPIAVHRWSPMIHRSPTGGPLRWHPQLLRWLPVDHWWKNFDPTSGPSIIPPVVTECSIGGHRWKLINTPLATLVEKKCVPCKDLARFSFKVLQDNAFFCKTSCKNLARNKFPCKILARNTISLKDSCKEYCFLERFLQGKKIRWKILARNSVSLKDSGKEKNSLEN